MNGERYRYWINNKNKQLEGIKFEEAKTEYWKTAKKYGKEVTKGKTNNLDIKIANEHI